MIGRARSATNSIGTAGLKLNRDPLGSQVFSQVAEATALSTLASATSILVGRPKTDTSR